MSRKIEIHSPRVEIRSKAAPDGGMCAFPFTQLYLNPNGLVTPCCYLAQDPWHVVGDTRTQSLEEIWNSPKMRSLRREFLEGRTDTCREQILASKCNRIRTDLLDSVTPREEMPFPMVRLDMMLNGKCNLECIMCGVWTMPNGVYDENGFWEEGRKSIFPHLKEIDIKGGEPFIQKDFFRMIDEVSAVNSKCLWNVTTNGHYKLTERIRSSLSRISLADVGISIDSLDPVTFARIRKKGELDRVLKTLDDWLDYRKEAGPRLKAINVNFVVQRDNWREIPAIRDFCRAKGVGLFYIILTNPAGLSVLDMPVEDRLEALELCVSAMAETRDPIFQRIIRPLRESLEGQGGAPGPDRSRRFERMSSDPDRAVFRG